ncbi:protein fem-1 homolog A-like [Lepeophtheirus salmonis]|uniref:protein fem-1 homolog A-like n=1 Tax=Lepeophtheirus salmonis TaxID=72036 RepID=UPI001AE61FCB|nr:protein fem-1 homolog C-like [Lepeophtheirus salmonis]
MRISKGYGDCSNMKMHCFTALVQECQLSAPGYKLSDSLKKKIEVFDKSDRKGVVDQTSEFGCTPLFLACKNGSAEVVEYLLTECEADIEQRGIFQVLDEGVSHSVTPLWCAAVSGRLSVVRVLIDNGADVNAASDSGSTPVRSACYIVRNEMPTSHFDIIQALVKAGANIQTPNHFGGTCLINSIQSTKLVKFLIDNDVDINAEDVQQKTALHYAVQENRFATAKLLMQNGADPMKVSKYGDDILQTACLKGNIMVFNYLIDKVKYDPYRIANAFELIGSTFLLDLYDLGSTLFFWKRALEIRYSGVASYPKEDLKVHPNLKVSEINSLEELDSSLTDLQGLKFQALIMSERILGEDHKDTIFRYMYCGASHADVNQYNECVHLWNYALKLKIRKDTLLSYDSSFTARAIVQLYVNILRSVFRSDNENMSMSEIREECEVSFKDVLSTTIFINEGLVKALQLLKVNPVFQVQLDNLDIILTSWIHLIHILLKMAISEEEMRQIYLIVKEVLSIDPKTSNGGDSVFHLAVSSSSTLKSNSFLDEENAPLFPSLELTKFILKCDFDVHKRNNLGETPLHIASKPANYSKEVIELLLSHQCHADVPDSNGLRALDLLVQQTYNLSLVSHISLKCLAAQVLRRNRMSEKVPIFLRSFVDVH